MADVPPVSFLRYPGIPGTNTPTYLLHARNAMLNTSGNKCVAVLMDPNDSTAPAGSGDATNITKIYVYESTDRVSWTLITTQTVTNAMDKSSTYHPMYACTIGPSNQVYIIYRATGGTLRSLGLNASTYTIAEDKQVAAAVTGGMWTAVDIDILQAPTGGVTTVLAMASYIKTATANDHIGYAIFHRRSSDGIWLTEKTQATDPGNAVSRQVNQASMCAIRILNGSTANTALRFAYAFNVMDINTDQGFGLQTATINADSGAGLVETATIFGYGASRNATAGSVIPTTITTTTRKHRVIDLFATNDSGSFIFTNSQFYSAGVSLYTGGYQHSGASNFVPTSTGIPGSVSVYTPHQSSYSNGITTFHYSTATTVMNQINWSGSWGGSYNQVDIILGPSWLLSGCSYYHGSNSTGWMTRINEDFLILYNGSPTGAQVWWANPLLPSPPPVSITPAQSSTVATSTPNLTATVTLNQKVPQGRSKVVWQLATASDFVTNARLFLQNDTKYTEIRGSDSTDKFVTFSDTLPVSQAIAQAIFVGATTWYIRAATVNEWGGQGAYSPYQTFIVSHPPSGTPISPSGSSIYGTGQVSFNWSFSDPYVNDYQVAYQVVGERNDTGATIYDSGKVVSAAKVHLSTALATNLKDVQLRWKVRLWDMDQAVSNFSNTLLFEVEDPPTVVINSPSGASVQTTPFATANFTPTVAGGRTITKYSVQVTQGSTTLFDTGGYIPNTPATATGVAIAYSSGTSIYLNNQQYSITVKVQDSDGLEGTSTTAFSTHWTPPNPATGVAVDITNYNVEGAGYVRVTWNDTARDIDFLTWCVYRKSDEIDLNTLAVTKAGTWEEIGTVYIPATTYLFDDYAAPAAHKVSYYVAQQVRRFGDVLESETITPVSVYPHSDGYWILMDTGSIRLSIVTGDSYTDEYEEETHAIFGRGRYVDRGSYLGITGALDVQLRNTGGTSARIKKQALENMKSQSQNTYLRTPFGDIYKVSVGNLVIGRIAGVGESEFCDVSIPYSQVAT